MMSILRLLGLGDKPSIKQISVSHAHELTRTGAIILIDVREPSEWNDTGRPQGAHGIALQDPNHAKKLLKLVNGDRSKPIAFSCKTGGRSSIAAEAAQKAGHSDVSNVEGGFLAWVAAERPVDYGPF